MLLWTNYCPALQSNMLQKNITPAMVPHAECGAPGCSQTSGVAMCFEDSDSDVQGTGPSIPAKVEMIIDSLRSSLSSQDAVKGNEGPGPASHTLHRAASMVELNDVKAEEHSQHSDSSDSVDREIEEAIQEYLKEKYDKNRMAAVDLVQGSKKLSRKKVKRELKPNSNASLAANNKVRKTRDVDNKCVGIKRFSEHRLLNKNKGLGRGLVHKCCSSLEMTKRPANSGFHSHQEKYLFCSFDNDGIEEETQRYQAWENKAVVSHGTFKSLELKEESDFSTDDGIEEAIQRYKPEKQNQNAKVSQTLCKPLELKEDSESSSDDGIEEAIQRYKLEKQNQKDIGSQTLCKPLELKEDSESSSDDGIEEAIQRYKLEKQNQEDIGSQTLCKPLEETDSSSDDGIEEAIQRYKLEKQKEKAEHSQIFSSSLQLGKNPVEAIHHFKLKNQKMNQKRVTEKHKFSKKKNTQKNKEQMPISFRTDQFTGSETQMVLKKCSSKKRMEDLTTVPVTPVVSCPSQNMPLSRCNINNNSVSSTRNVPPVKSQIVASVNVNTSSGLIGAKAILDTSKTIMPATMNHMVTLSTSSVYRLSFLSRDSINSHDNNNNSSLDRGDNAAKEVSELHESDVGTQKQSCERTLSSSKKGAIPEQQNKANLSHNKKMRLSLSRKRKMKKDFHMEQRSQHMSLVLGHTNNGSLTSISTSSSNTLEDFGLKHTANTEEGVKKNGKKDSLHMKENTQKISKSHKEDCAVLNKSGIISYRREDTGELDEDKSSSLESDEELHTAIKDLLKSKKKAMDTGLKSKKSVSFGTVQLCRSDGNISDEGTPAESNTRYFEPAKSCISKNVKLARKQKLISNRRLKRKMNQGSIERLDGEMITEKEVQTGTTMYGTASSNQDIEKDCKSLDSDDRMEHDISGLLVKKERISKEITKVVEPYRISTRLFAHSLAAKELHLESQLPDSQGSAKVQCSTEAQNSIATSQYFSVTEQPVSVEERVPQNMSVDLRGRSKFWTNNNSYVKTEATEHTFKNDQPNEAIELKPERTVKRSPLVPSAVKGNNKLAESKCLSSAVAEKTLPQSHDQNLFHTDSLNSIDAEEIQLTNASDSPAQSDINNCNSNNLVNTCHHPQDAPADASSQLPAFNPPTHLDRCLGQMRQGTQVQVPDPTLLKNVVHVVENRSMSVDLSTHGANNVPARDRVLVVADESGNPERNVEQMKVEEQNMISDAETDYVDETDSESDERKEASQSSGEKKLRHRLFLTTAIDPGMKFTTYIALNTLQRHEKYIKARTLAFTADQQINKGQPIKGKLSFTSIN
ncbi:protein phosphatase 1 regulatory subunit 26-like isoform X2 [Brienomyrus brachyistius]|uniref:protein phosphatase 1 regulatory subunit 26-like isoform X2 n=1 Tax=Brienomyrus brachyistius TaxID=42636 RepID=UPI0020B2BD4E|nr:protein phosphatase 1 regulatory subunit 26-like isoform X2 [Brienomyrus brachyistius]